MAADMVLARALKRTKTVEQLEAALGVVVDSLLAPDDVLEQRLEAVDFRMQVKSVGERRGMVETIEAAIHLHEGENPVNNMAHLLDFSKRRTEP